MLRPVSSPLVHGFELIWADEQTSRPLTRVRLVCAGELGYIQFRNGDTLTEPRRILGMSHDQEHK